MVYFFADPHFGDKNIMKLENRPFVSVSDMNSTIIRNWNKKVNPEDEVFLLGDIIGAVSIPLIEIKTILDTLQGKITIIAGNHDKGILQDLRDWGYIVSEYPIIYKEFWIVSHEPVYLNKFSVYGNIFGHVHGNPMYKTVSSRSYCVSAERVNYTPISFDEIVSKIHLENE